MARNKLFICKGIFEHLGSKTRKKSTEGRVLEAKEMERISILCCAWYYHLLKPSYCLNSMCFPLQYVVEIPGRNQLLRKRGGGKKEKARREFDLRIWFTIR